jgi:hypothetical protein
VGGQAGHVLVGYKLHVTQTCDDQPECGCPGSDGHGSDGHGRGGHDKDCPAPAFANLITHVATTDATVTDSQVTAVIDDQLAGKALSRNGTTSIRATCPLPWW